MKRLFVWVRDSHNVIRLAGELGMTDPAPANGRFTSEFEYAPEWTALKTAFPLDPESSTLHTMSRRFSADLLYPPLAVFDDALPDDWGRSLLSAALKLEGHKSTPAGMLLRMRGGGTGALLFTETPTPPEPLDTVQSSALSVLLSAAEKFEAGTLPLDDEFRRLLEGSSRAGGARPKALVHDEEGEWLAKFFSVTRDGPLDVIGLEATCLTLARNAGLETPQSRLQPVGSRRVLMVRRFDVTPENGRLHMVSLRTLCRERPGLYAHGYADLAQAVRKHSAAPLEDVTALFRHMVFNAAIGNVDDHLKNFWMLVRSGGYRLAPAFDLVPDITGRREHTLSFQLSTECPKRTDLMAIAHTWDIMRPAAIIDRVVEAVSDFPATALRLDVSGKGVENIAADIEKRLALLRA